MLPAAILNRVLGVRNSTFLDTISILENDPISNGAGGTTDNWVVASTVKGRIDRTQAGIGVVQTAGGQVQPIFTWEVRVDPSAPITIANRLRVNGQDYIIRNDDFGRTAQMVMIINCDPVTQSQTT